MGPSSFTYERAAELLMERFPTLGLLVNGWEPKEWAEEAVPSFELGKEEVFYFYGLSPKVYFKCKKWLTHPENKLVFLEDDPGVIAAFLQMDEAGVILGHPQVYIEHFFKEEAEIEALADKFPAKRIEMSSLPSKKGFKSLRLNLLRKTVLAHALHEDRLHGYQIFSNFCQNVKQLPDSFYVNGLKGAFQGTPAIVCGAGPSLSSTVATLERMGNRALIIAGGSTLAALSSRGIEPHFGMALDPNLEEYRRFRNSFAFEVPLIYSTRVHPGVFQTCNGPLGYMRSGIGGLLELWIEEELKLEEPLLGDFLSPETVSVTGICVAFAQFLGCSPILLNGIDMAYTGGVRYASGVDGDERIVFDEIDREKSAADRIVRKKDRLGKTVYSAIRWVMESASISHFAKMDKKTKFINTTSGGIGFQGIDYMPIEEAVLGFEERDLRSEVFAAIQNGRMPKNSRQKIKELMGELRRSLERVICHLKVLSLGPSPLAEIELQEEIAVLFLFYDIRRVLKAGPTFWLKWLELAKKYKAMFS